jgi:hypothetical protein
MSMSKKHYRYFIVPTPEGWRILFQGTLLGPFRTQTLAIASAIDSAHRAAGKAQVYVQKDEIIGTAIEGEPDAFRLVWTYGVDPYPPPRATRPPSTRKGRSE